MAQLSYAWFNANDFGATFFPAAGVTLAALTVTRTRWWPFVIAGAVVAELTLNSLHGLGLPASSGYALANMVEPLVGAGLMRLVVGRVDLARVRDVIAFLGMAVVCAPAVGAAIGATTFVLIEEGEGWWSFAGQWWTGDGLGVLVVGGAILAVASSGERIGLRAVSVEGVVLILLAVLSTGVVFRAELVLLAFVPLALLVVVAFRVGTRGVAVAGAGVAFVSAEETSNGHVFWDSLGIAPDTGLIYLQLTLGFVVALPLLLAATLRSRDRAVVELAGRAGLLQAETLARRHAELLGGVSRRLASARSPQEIMTAIHRDGFERLGAAACSLGLISPSDPTMIRAYALGFPDHVTDRYAVISRNAALPGPATIRNGCARYLETREQTASQFPQAVAILAPTSYAAAACVPIQADGVAIGYAAAHFIGERRFDDDERRLIETIAAVAGQALERVRLSELDAIRRDRAEGLQQLAAALNAAATMDDVAEAVIIHAAGVTGSLRATIALHEATGDRLRMRSGPEAAPGAWSEISARAAAPEAVALRSGPVVLRSADEIRNRFPQTAREVAGLRSLCAVPLQGVDGVAIGSLVFHWGRTQTPDPVIFETVDVVAAMVVQAIDRARLLESEREARQHSEILRTHASQLAGAVLPLDVAAATSRSLRDGFQPDGCGVGLVEGDSLVLIYVEGVSEDVKADWARTPLDTPGAMHDAARTGQWVEVHGDEGRRARYPAPAVEAMRPFESLIHVPLPDRAGVIGLGFAKRRILSQPDRDLLDAIATQLSQALERARLAERDRAARHQEERARRRSELIAEILGALESVQGFAARAERLIAMLVPRLADYATIEAPDAEQPIVALTHRDPRLVPTLRALRERHRLEPEAPYSVARAAAGEKLLLSRIGIETLEEHAANTETLALLEKLGPHSHAAVPLVSREDAPEPLVLMVGLTGSERRPYDAGDLAFLTEIAARAGVVLDASRLTEREHRVAEELQRALLPADLPSPGEVACAARYVPGEAGLDVGGDWYDALVLSDGRLLLGVGDVVGRGLSAAATMGRLRTAAAALAPGAGTVGDLLTRLDAFADSVDGGKYATTAYATLDPLTGSLHYAAAGHPPFLIIDSDGDCTYLEDGRSCPLATGDGVTRESAAAVVPPGATLLLYSDGLIERRGEVIDCGLQRLADAARDAAGLDVEEMCDAIIAHCLDGQVKDDVVLLAVRFTDVPAEFSARIAAGPGELAPLRRRFGQWLDLHGADPEERYAVLVGVGEACMNAVEHAYLRGESGVVEFTASVGAHDIHVTVRDHGTWRTGAPGRDRGRGTPIMNAMSALYARHTTDTGTVVEMRFRLASPAHA